ncbi:MAG: DUF4352 domain-containing protein [Clostridia bacterium]
MKHWSRIFKLILAIIVVATLMISCKSTGRITIPVAPNSKDGTGTVQKPTIQRMNVGETVQIGNLKFTVKGVREDSGNTLIPLKGYRWVLVDVAVENLGQEADYVNHMMWFALHDSNGKNCPTAVAAKQRGELSGDIPGNGGTRQGELEYQITTKDKQLELEIQPGTDAPSIAYCAFNAP